MAILNTTPFSLLLLLCYLLGALGQNCSSTMYIDIFDNLITHDPLTASTLKEAPSIPGIDKTAPAYEFAGLGAGFSSTDLSDDIRKSSCASNEVTFTSRVFIRDSQSDGPLLELMYTGGLNDGIPVYLLHMDAAANRIVLAYRHRGRLQSEAIPIRLIGGRWRDYAITLSGNLLSFHFDCQLVLQREVPLPDYCANDTSIVLNVARSMNPGVEYTGSTGLYVYAQNVGIHFGPGGVSTQCPDLPDLCTSCGQFFSLLERFSASQEKVAELEAQVMELEVENADCSVPTVPPTIVDGTNCIVQEGEQMRVITDGQFLLIAPNMVCFCNKGIDVCANIDNINVNSPTSTSCVDTSITTTPVQNDDPEPPVRMCTVSNVNLEIPEGESGSVQDGNRCIVYTCQDGAFGLAAVTMVFPCDDIGCSGLSQERAEASRCCGFCDACDFTTCHENSNCIVVDSSASGSATCVCSDGYSQAEDGSCVDIDECSLGFRLDGHNCPPEADCVNLVGSLLFECVCRPGYTQEVDDIGLTVCYDIDECANDTHTCGQFSTCENTDGGFECNCIQDHVKDASGTCVAVCDPPCENGGVCDSPYSCTCPVEYSGEFCKTDVNECTTGLHSCNNQNQSCVNTVGGHFCRCDSGFQEKDSKCIDINECSSRIHNCQGSTCINTNGGYLCLCKSSTGVTTNCTGSCIKNSVRYDDGSSFVNSECRECTCHGGEMTCRRLQCDCDNLDEDVDNAKCCQNCFQRNCDIKDGTITIRPGSSWINPSDPCERYDCSQDLTPVFVNVTANCPVLDCPEALQSVTVGKCCPTCMMPSCDPSLEGETVLLRNGCSQCTCENSSWSCSDSVQCPVSSCLPTDIVFYRAGCCPVCIHEVLSTAEPFCLAST